MTRKQEHFSQRIADPERIAKYQNMRTGASTDKDNPRRAIWYGPCAFWTDEWDTLTASPGGIPTCPGCGAPGSIIEAGQWFDGLDRYDQENPEDKEYRLSVMALFNKCPNQVNP